MSDLVIKFTQAPFYIKSKDVALDEAKNLIMSKGISVTPEIPVKTPNIFICTAIVLVSKLMNKIFHIAPELENEENVRKILAKDIEKMRKIPNNSDVSVAIIGGIETKAGDKESTISQRIYNAAAEVAFDEYNCNGIMACGKKRGDSLENIKVEGNEITIYTKDFNINNQSLDDRYQSFETHGKIDIII